MSVNEDKRAAESLICTGFATNRSCFDTSVEDFLEHMDGLLLSKNEAYGTQDDRFYNFNVGAEVLNCSPEKAAWSYAAKHIASICKMVDSPDAYDTGTWLEKLGDLANYACLIYAMRCCRG